MELKRYFEDASGVGVLATADQSGIVNTAIYARPHVCDDGIIAFIMRKKKSRENLKENNSASYLFKENSGYKGLRLTLEMIDETDDPEKIEEMRRRTSYGSDTDEPRFLVRFSVVNARTLIGDQQLDLE